MVVNVNNRRYVMVSDLCYSIAFFLHEKKEYMVHYTKQNLPKMYQNQSNVAMQFVFMQNCMSIAKKKRERDRERGEKKRKFKFEHWCKRWNALNDMNDCDTSGWNYFTLFTFHTYKNVKYNRHKCIRPSKMFYVFAQFSSKLSLC